MAENASSYNYEFKFAKQDYLNNSYFIRVTVHWNKLPEDSGKVSQLLIFSKIACIHFALKNLKPDYVLPDRT